MGYCQACCLWAHPPKIKKPAAAVLQLGLCVRGNNTGKRKQTQSLTLKGLRTMLDLFF